jgi:ABC-type dipeptide/oligopeptide/nickel transport system permease component
MLRRILFGILTVFGVVTVVFFLLRLIPGDPVAVWLGDYATPELIDLTKIKWGLDQPIWDQYVIYMKNILHGDMGNSLRMKFPVAKLLLRHYPYTIRLCILAVSLSIIIAIPVGIIAALRQNSFIDMFAMTFSFIFISMPAFWLGLLGLFLFSFHLGWFPAIGGEKSANYLTYFPHLTLPVLCLGLWGTGSLVRMVRSAIIDTLGKDFVNVLRGKGLKENLIIYKHVLRNSLIPIVSFVGVNLILALAGTVTLEIVFSRPGLGRLYVNAVAARDYPLIQGCILVICIAVVLVNLVVDISYGIIDPRIRYE